MPLKGTFTVIYAVYYLCSRMGITNKNYWALEMPLKRAFTEPHTGN